MLDVIIQRDIIPQADLRLQGSWENWLKLGSDIAPMLAILAAQGPLGPKLVTCDEEGQISVEGISHPIGFTGNLWPGGPVGGGDVSEIIDVKNMENLEFLVQSDVATVLSLYGAFVDGVFFNTGQTLNVVGGGDEVFRAYWPWRLLKVQNGSPAQMQASVQAKPYPIPSP